MRQCDGLSSAVGTLGGHHPTEHGRADRAAVQERRLLLQALPPTGAVHLGHQSTYVIAFGAAIAAVAAAVVCVVCALCWLPLIYQALDGGRKYDP